MMNRSNVEWTDYVWNPITGCRKGCEYCFLPTQINRFSGDVRMNLGKAERWKDTDLCVLREPFKARNGRSLPFPYGMEPTLHLYRMDNPNSRPVGANIYVCSMGEMFGPWVPDEWIKLVFDACSAAPQHNYMFLTKYPERYLTLAQAGELPMRDNMWYGSSVQTEDTQFFYATGYHTFLCVEPLMGDFTPPGNFREAEWVIVGPETSRKKNRVIPGREWIDHITDACRQAEIPVFLRNALADTVGEDLIQEYPDMLTRAPKLTEKQRERLMTRCGFCKKELPKKSMTAILSREGRGIQPASEGYLCDDCFQKLREIFAKEEPFMEENNV